MRSDASEVSLVIPELVSGSFDPMGPAEAFIPPGEAVAEACLALARAGEPPGIRRAFSRVGAPWLDMALTPMSARASLLGIRTGRAFAHHELRRRLPLPEEMAPEIDVGATEPSWVDGVLTEVKYFSFFQDAPIPVFNPVHRRKWRSHELLHGAAPFFWSPLMGRFDCYLGARLAELLPVVHWYGFDEMLRPRCALHQDKPPVTAFCAACESSAVAYWERPVAEGDGPRARFFATSARAHFAQEWQACITEARTGQQVVTRHHHLNAASDAVGYLRGHWNRLTSARFGAWVETFLEDGVDFVSTLSEAFETVALAALGLTSGAITVRADELKRRRARKVLQDLGYRSGVALDGWRGLRATRGRAALEPIMAEAGALCRRLHRGEGLTDVAPLIERWRAAIPGVDQRSPIGAQGLLWPAEAGRTGQSRADAIGEGLPQLIQGLRQASPMATEAAGARLRVLAEAFAASPFFEDGGRLAVRFGRWAQAAEVVIDDHVRSAAIFEGALADEPRLDEEAERFLMLPDEDEALEEARGMLRSHRTLRFIDVDVTLGEALLGEPFEGQLAAIWAEGEPRLLPIDDAIAAALAHPTGSHPPELLFSLIDNGFLVWLPSPSL